MSFFHLIFLLSIALIDLSSASENPCGRKYTSSPGEFSYPPNGGNYGNYQQCVIEIEAPAGVGMTVDFPTFRLESSSTCGWDYLEVKENPASSGPRYCGTGAPGNGQIITDSNYMQLYFQSDEDITSTGFSVRYSFNGVDRCSTELTSTCVNTTGSCINLPSTWACQCLSGYQNPAGDNQTCETIGVIGSRCADIEDCYPSFSECANLICSCSAGYIEDAGSCVLEDKCTTEDTSSCQSATGTCVNGAPTWGCQCSTYYENPPGNSQTCQIEDKCSREDTSSCQSDAGTCVNVIGSWRCECHYSYLNLEGNTQTCRKVFVNEGLCKLKKIKLRNDATRKLSFSNTKSTTCYFEIKNKNFRAAQLKIYGYDFSKRSDPCLKGFFVQNGGQVREYLLEEHVTCGHRGGTAQPLMKLRSGKTGTIRLYVVLNGDGKKVWLRAKARRFTRSIPF